MAQHTIDLPCIADTYCSVENLTSNYGNATILRCGGYWGQMSGYQYFTRFYALMKFDPSSLPLRKQVIEAKIRVYSVSSMPSGEEAEVLYGTHDIDWNEASATFLSQGDKSGGAIAYFKNGIPSNAWVEINVSNVVHQALINGEVETKGLYFYWTNETSPSYWELHSRENTNKPALRVIYEDVPPNAPTPTEPIGAYKDSKSVIHFAWNYNSDVGGVQKKFDLQWSTDQSTWTTVSETTANNYYDMPADTLPAGNIYWRVRTYNEYDEVGPYCDIQSFYSIGAPNAPAINTIPTDTARPTVTWSAFSQQVYQLQVLSGDTIVYDSGVVPGINIRQHKIKAWLADGAYTVQLRIKNEYDMWSDWGISAVTISTVKPTKPALTLQLSAHGVEISATGLVYRSEYDKDNFICIGTASGTYYDNTVASGKEYKYFVRAVSENDTFADSDVKFIQADFRHSLIAPVSNLNNVFVFMHGLNTPPNRTYNRQPGGASVMYAGRTCPVWEPTEHVSAGMSLTFFLMTWDDVERFIKIYDLKGTVLYRDSKGRKIYGTLSNLSVNDDILGYIVSFTINQVDYDEGV